MIPDFDENGNLPPGIHWTDWDEFVARFATTPRRNRMMEGLKQAMEQLKSAGCRTIYINGSFVTSKPNPNDFDACWESQGVDMDYLRLYAPRLYNYFDREGQKAKYRGELFCCDQPVGNYGNTSLDFFQSDRLQNFKGIIAIDLTRWEP